VKAYYNKYCKILSSYKKGKKTVLFEDYRNKSNNKIKTAWNVIKRETGKCHQTKQISSVLINNRKVNDQQKIADAFNIHFFIITENLELHEAVKGETVSLLRNAFLKI
jgi:hypothetical protein